MRPSIPCLSTDRSREIEYPLLCLRLLFRARFCRRTGGGGEWLRHEWPCSLQNPCGCRSLRGLRGSPRRWPTRYQEHGGAPMISTQNGGSSLKGVESSDQDTLPKAPRSDRLSSISWMGLTILTTNVGLAVLMLWSWTAFGSIGSGLGYLRGDRLIPDAYTKTLGVVERGSTPNLNFILTNASSVPMTILGGKSPCTCVLTVNLPMTIPPSKCAPFTIKVLTHRKSGKFSESIRLYTDNTRAGDITLKIRGFAKDPS